MVKFILAAAALAVAGCGESGAAPMKNESTPIAELALSGRVVDQADPLDDAAERGLNERLARLERMTTDQLVVVTIPSLKGQTIEKVGLELGNRWGIGRADADNGVMILVAPSERKVRIEVGLGLEGLLTDERAATIIQRQILPAFKQAQMAAGIAAGVAAIDDLLSSDLRRPQPKLQPTKKAA